MFKVENVNSLDLDIKDKVFRVIPKEESFLTEEIWTIEAILYGIDELSKDPVMDFIGGLENDYENVRVYREPLRDHQTGRFGGLSILYIEFDSEEDAEDYCSKLNTKMEELANA